MKKILPFVVTFGAAALSATFVCLHEAFPAALWGFDAGVWLMLLADACERSA